MTGTREPAAQGDAGDTTGVGGDGAEGAGSGGAVAFGRNFPNKAGDFSGYSDATCYLTTCGFSVGRMQADEPIGILFGQYDIQKWRNLRRIERETLHGTPTGDKRNGPVKVVIFASAPTTAQAAITRAALAKAEAV